MVPNQQLIDELKELFKNSLDFLFYYTLEFTGQNEHYAQDAVQNACEAVLRAANASGVFWKERLKVLIMELCRYYAKLQCDEAYQEVPVENPNCTELANLSDVLFEKMVRDDSPVELRKKLTSIKPHYYEVLILRFFYQLDYDSIAAILQISKNAAYARVSRAKDMAEAIYLDLDENGGGML